MGTRDRQREALAVRMRRAHFDISPLGVLTYLDPAIGALANPSKGIAARVCADTFQIELIVNGRTEATWDLRENVAEACASAFGGYFGAFERLCLETAEVCQAA